jgi:hypothetical protein
LKPVQQLIQDVTDKVLPKLTDSAEKWTNDENFLEILGKAGSIGALISVGIAIYDKYKDEFKSPKELAYLALIKITLQSAKEILKDNEQDDTANIKEINHDKLTNKFKDKSRIKLKKDLLVGLFDIFKNEESKFIWNSHLPNHPVVIEFKERLINLFTESNEYPDDIRQFIIDLNISIEEKATNDQNIKVFNDWYSIEKRSKELTNYLIFAQTFMDIANPVDNKRLSEYYVRNKSFIVDIENWNKPYKNLPVNLEEWVLERDLLNNNETWYTVIGAPFGIGKTSMAMDIVSEFAKEYLENPNNPNNYIPIFVRLRDKLKGVYQGRDLDYVLNKVIGSETRESRNRNILLVCDGLDEYSNNEHELVELYNKLSKYASDFSNLKVIITSRLKAGWARKLFPISNYVRLFPFDKNQIINFFNRYGIIKLQTEFDKFEETDGLSQDEIGKPLFCWMFAIINSDTNKNVDKSENKTIFDNLDNSYAKRALIYQQFIHSVVRGKYKEVSRTENHVDWNEDNALERNEKNLLRNIAALKQIHKEKLSIGILNEGLSSLGIEIADKETIEKVIDPVITSYFYIGSSSSSILKDQFIDFIHNSFIEYLIAEYYIENLINEGGMHVRLCIGIPTRNIISFLNGLIYILFTNHDNLSLNQIRNRMLSSLYHNKYEKIDISQIRSRLITRLWEAVKDNRLIYLNKVENNAFDKSNHKLWNLISDPQINYAECWIHRHICFYILQQLINKEIKSGFLPSEYIQEKRCIDSNFNDKEIITEFMRKDSQHVPWYLKDYSILNLEGLNLSEIDLVRSDFSYSNLSDTIMQYTNLSSAILKEANLTGADLTDANLKYTKLPKANLSEAILINTNLFNADLQNAKIFRAITSGIDITDTNFSVVEDLENSESTISSFFFKEHSNFCIDNLNSSELSIRKDIRFIGLVNSRFEFLCGIQKKGVERLLSKEDKQIMIHIAAVGQGFRSSIIEMGNGIYFTEEYEKLVRVSIPLSYSEENCINEPQAKSIFITLEKSSNVENVLKILLKKHENCIFNKYFFALNNPKNHESNKIKEDLNNSAYRSDELEYNKLCQRVIKLDENHHYIRDTYVFDRNYKIHGQASRPGLKDILPDPAQKELAMKITWARVKLREKFHEKIGKWEFALGVYENLKRMTFPLRDQFDHIQLVLLITLEPESDHEKIRQNVKKILSETEIV